MNHGLARNAVPCTRATAGVRHVADAVRVLKAGGAGLHQALACGKMNVLVSSVE